MADTPVRMKQTAHLKQKPMRSNSRKKAMTPFSKYASVTLPPAFLFL